MKTLNEQHKLIKEGKGHKGVFLKEAKTQFPQWIRNAATYKEATTILKDKGIINENLVSLGAVNQSVSPPKESYETAFQNFIQEVKAEEKNTTKEVIDLEIAGYDYKDKEDPNNMIFDQIMKGYYTEMKNPKNSEKTMEELKGMVIKNLAKDPIYYTNNGQFGIEDLGYQTEAPGLGRGKQVKDAGPGGGYGTPTKKDFPEGQVGTGFVEVPKKVEGSGLIVVAALNENKDSDNTTENLHEQKLRKVINNIIREELNENVQKELKSIDKEAEVETIKMKIERIEAAIEKRQAQLSKLDEDEDLKNLTDKKKLKALGKDIKVLEKAKAKLEKTLAKLTGKKKKEVLDEDTVTEAEGDAEEAKETADELERAADAAKEIGDTELFEEDDEVDYRKESLTKIANEAEEMFEKLTGRDGSPDGLDDMDALKNVLSEFPAYMGEEIEFVEKHLMGKYDLGNA